MALLQKSDLLHNYSWTALKGDDPRLTGIPDNILLARHEGYEVLPFINRFAEEQKWKQKVSGLKLEWLIQKHLPADIRSRANVRAWLIQNWKTYDNEWNHKVARGDLG